MGGVGLGMLPIKEDGDVGGMGGVGGEGRCGEGKSKKSMVCRGEAGHKEVSDVCE
jgi:hypothetical protein